MKIEDCKVGMRVRLTKEAIQRNIVTIGSCTCGIIKAVTPPYIHVQAMEGDWVTPGIFRYISTSAYADSLFSPLWWKPEQEEKPKFKSGDKVWVHDKNLGGALLGEVHTPGLKLSYVHINAWSMYVWESNENLKLVYQQDEVQDATLAAFAKAPSPALVVLGDNTLKITSSGTVGIEAPGGPTAHLEVGTTPTPTPESKDALDDRCRSAIMGWLMTVENELPKTFYADRPVHERVRKLADHWRRMSAVNVQLEERVERLKDALQKAYELVCSSYSVALRDGNNTNWETLRKKLKVGCHEAYYAIRHSIKP